MAQNYLKQADNENQEYQILPEQLQIQRIENCFDNSCSGKVKKLGIEQISDRE